MTSKFLGSWPTIAGIWIFCIGWLFFGSIESLTFVLSVLALTFSQLILRDTDRITAKQNEKLDAIVHGTDADDSVADD